METKNSKHIIKINEEKFDDVNGCKHSKNNWKINAIFLFLLCWVTYAFSYVTRLNMSIALPILKVHYGEFGSDIGLINSLFFFSYAFGQLLNGIVGDYISPGKMLVIGISGIVFSNCIIAMYAMHFIIVCIFWTMNAFFQSMIWAPLIKKLSYSFAKKYHMNISTYMMTAITVGYLLVWCGLGAFKDIPVYLYFLIPAVGIFCVLPFWIFQKKSKNEVNSTPDLKGQVKNFFKTIKELKYYRIVIACFCMGFMKESVTFLLPIIISTEFGYENGLLIAFVPVANFLGIILVKALAYRQKSNAMKILMVLFGIALAGSLFLASFNKNASIFVVLVGFSAVTSCMFGCNVIFLSYLPLRLGGKTYVSGLIGVFDFSSYMGAGASSLLFGILVVAGKWYIVPYIWVVVLVFALVITVVWKIGIVKEDNAGVANFQANG